MESIFIYYIVKCPVICMYNERKSLALMVLKVVYSFLYLDKFVVKFLSRTNLNYLRVSDPDLTTLLITCRIFDYFVV